jgi:hypothetical protein
MTKRGNDILNTGYQKIEEGNVLEGAGDVVRGSLMQGAAPAAVVAIIPAVALAPGVIAGGALAGTVFNTALAITATTYGLGHNAEACGPDALSTGNKALNCAVATGFTAMGALNAYSAVAMSNVQIANTAARVLSEAELATAGTTATTIERMIPGAAQSLTSNVQTAAAVQQVAGKVGAVLFAEQAIEACAFGLDDGTGTRHFDAASCALNAAMAATSLANVSIASSQNVSANVNKVVQTADFGVNTAQAVVGCASSVLAKGDTAGCVMAAAGAFGSGVGMRSAFVEEATAAHVTPDSIDVAETPQGRLLKVQADLANLFEDPLNPVTGQYKAGVTPQQIESASALVRSALVEVAQVEAATRLALGNRPDLSMTEQALRGIGDAVTSRMPTQETATQKTLTDAQTAYKTALDAYNAVPQADRLASPELSIAVNFY